MKLDCKHALMSLALGGLALGALPGVVCAQQGASAAAPAPSVDLRVKVITAEQALAGVERAAYISERDASSRRQVAARDEARAAVAAQIAAGARTLRAALASPESLAVTTETPVPAQSTPSGLQATARSYIPEPPKAGMLGRVTSLAKIGGNKDKDVNQAIGKGVDEATQKASAQAVLTTLKLEFLYAVAALEQVSKELNVIEVAAAGKPTDLAPLADRYVAAIERAEEVLDIELPRLAMMAGMAANSTELPEATRAKYKAAGDRIAATVGQWAVNRTLFARSERNAMDFLALASGPTTASTDVSTVK